MGILNSDTDLADLCYFNDGLPTDSSIAQSSTEDSVRFLYTDYKKGSEGAQAIERHLSLLIVREYPPPCVNLCYVILLTRDKHIKFLNKGLQHLSRWLVALDASKPWLTYWILHSLELLEYEIPRDIIESITKLLLLPSIELLHILPRSSRITHTRGVRTISKWQNSDGGFGGGANQISHLAPTYASINTLATLGTDMAYGVIDRDALYGFLMRMKLPDGSFRMHDGGEIDIRGLYCALSVAAMTNLLTPELTENCAQFILR
ncbi:LOW QUALITY PROTEIN: terpenoid cyclases/protein prenyltransferase alpha-alpha toroid [Jimgerdemannia flammicorona]|uniref:Terpenoid cyclases/protein prenyltransferase alpha-alpha toroid n=1 Tax=Jimgerdemannia flammicorona TaxID=994334 RepID=A0A433CWT0_9FUNG|nr:LOW QUALITY PROTEIN: terpenoid cyclases/protein prenyltransferase alpha-alpha toroid [Jimgerdemannia flammicorona]